jgi:UDP-N-acetylmuramoylalanine--D-glutamate ligase
MALDLSSIENFQDAVVTVMGLGRFKQGSGVGAAKWLMRHGAQIVITDLKSEEELQESIDEVMKWYSKYRKEYDNEIYQPIFVMGEHRKQDFEGVDLVVQNPGVPRESEFVQYAKEQGVKVESDISLFFRYCPFPIYTITGTRGKSTTSALFGRMLEHKHPKTVVAGNITRSPLEDLDWLLEEDNPVPVVLELSSWLLESLENAKTGPEIAIFTTMFKDHLDRYDSFEGYLAAKQMMFKDQTEDQFAVLNYDNKWIRETGENKVTAQKFWFSMEGLPDDMQGSYLRDDGMLVVRRDGEEEICERDRVLLRGDHNIQNSLAAITAARLAGVDIEAIRDALEQFGGLPGRQEILGEFGGVMYVNDTTATSQEGVIAALRRFGEDNDVVLITGGTAKGLTYEKMGEVIGEECKYVVYLEGSATDDIKAAVGGEVSGVRVGSMKEAVSAAVEAAETGDVVIMSPGTSSFGMFKNEFDRGEQFKDAVNALAN